MERLQTIDKYAAQLLMIGFFLPQAVQAIAIIGVCGYFTLRMFFSKGLVFTADLLWAFLLGSLFFLYAIAIPFTLTADRHIVLSLLTGRIALLLLPILFSIIMPTYGNVLMRELKYFVYACLVACVIANLAFVYHFYSGGAVAGPQAHVAYRQYLEHFLKLHPTYLSMYIVFAICILLCGYVQTSRMMKLSLLYLLLVFLLAILAKSPLIALFVICIHYAYQHRALLYKYKVMFVIMLAGLIACCFFIPFIGQRLGEMSGFFNSSKTVANNSMFERKMIWDTDISLLHRYWLTGTGPGRLIRLLDYRYLFYSISHQFPTGYFDPHNEYLWEWLSFGIVGILVSIGVLLLHLIMTIRSRNHLYLYLLCILCITFATESVLSRQQGILFYAVFTSMFFFYKQDKIHKFEV